MKILDLISKFFNVYKRGSSVRKEVVAGIGMFLTISYAVVVCAYILSAAGMPRDKVLIAACLTSAIGTIVSGFFSRIPITMAPGMGLCLFFTYVMVMGQHMKWETALGAVFISGVLFFILSVAGLRDMIMKSLPAAIIDAASGGIGLYIAITGLKEMKLSVADPNAIISASCLLQETYIGLAALLLIVVLEVFRVRGAILFGIIFAAVSGYIFHITAAPAQIMSMNFSIAPLFLKLDIAGALKVGFMGSILTLMFIDMFDGYETPDICSTKLELDSQEREEALKPLLATDAGTTIFGSLMGVSTTTSCMESVKGIEDGGRTGLASIVAGLLLLILIPFHPFLASIPGYALAPAYIIIGLILMSRIRNIDYSSVEAGFPAFITILIMPSTSSISIGLAAGFTAHLIIKLVRRKFADLNPVLILVTLLLLIGVIV
ncbi:MAG: NCS2 family permease [Firmicutes bacterium]|nr:NCS2 family permease [Bacillota bacterium]